MGTPRIAVVLSVLVLLAGACSAKGEEADAEIENDSEQTDSGDGADVAMFGDMPSPCGEGDLSVTEGEGPSTDTLQIGVANDRTSDIRPGLNKEMWDASNAFASWCNSQGGIGGLPIEVVDLDAALFEVESAMTRACSDAFMMVGGGWVQDNLSFTGKPESDFHLCGMADIPGIAVSPEKAESNGHIQPVPHVSGVAPNGWAEVMLELEPEKGQTAAVVWGTIPSLEVIKDQDSAAIESAGVEIVDTFDYPPTGLTDWTPLASDVVSSGAGTLHFVGEPTNLGAMLRALGNQGWDGVPVVSTNMYDQTTIDGAGAENAEGMIIRSLYPPFEEADEWPAVAQFVDILNEEIPDAKQALLGMQSFSAWLLFATAAQTCGESNDGVLTRACVLEAAAATEDWTAGGLHAETSPGPEGGTPRNCFMQITVNAEGEFERLHPEVGSDDDDGEGFHCAGELVEVPTGAGLGVVGPDQPI